MSTPEPIRIPKRLPAIKVVERKLGKYKAVGIAYHGDGLIEIDPRQKSKDRLDTLTHEWFHMVLPEATEQEVIRLANHLTRILWGQGYRRIYKE